MAREITYNNFEISLVVFMPNITINHAITYTLREIPLCNRQNAIGIKNPHFQKNIDGLQIQTDNLCADIKEFNSSNCKSELDTT